jgi:hypothetical protein
MKRAVIRQRRHDPAGRQLINVVCPRCDGRHWLPVDASGICPRRGGTFAIETARRNGARR